MNFFEQQARAKTRSRWLLLMFAMAVVAIVIAIDLLLLVVLGLSPLHEEGVAMLSREHLRQNLPLLIGGAVVSVLVIGLASMYRISSLRSGGGQVARELGGILVDSEPSDPLRRRLRNVVEEIALASGVPVPEIYVLEKESGINAFAAGFSPADAAIAVTRGCLERLSREELQGVIAHEFSHILNGDMRLNIGLMGALFGILLLAIIGRRVLIHGRHFGRGRDKHVIAVFAIAFGLLMVGYVGQFFGRWIKSAVSRQREYLADASAVQFTRDNLGIGGALKKIAVFGGGSVLTADTEEISHMLFGNGRKQLLFATHPPIEKRIKRVDPAFRPEELEQLKAQLINQEAKRAREREDLRIKAAAEAAASGAPRKGVTDLFLDPGRLIEQIGKPGWESILLASSVRASIPLNVRRAAQSTEWAAAVLVYTLLDQDREIKEQQLLLVTKTLGDEVESQVRSLIDAGGDPGSEQRLPLLELAFPALKRHPLDYISKVLSAVQQLVALDGRIDIFEYLLSRVTVLHVWESQSPSSVRMAGNKNLSSCREHALRLLSILASHGNETDNARQAAFAAGVVVLGEPGIEMPQVADWPATLDRDLPVLDRLAPAEKQKLLAALIATVMKDGKAVTKELELLRVTCDLLHVPLPMVSTRKH